MGDTTPTLAGWTARHYADAVDKIVAELHAMADRFAREARPAGTSFGDVPRHLAAAERACTAMAWDLANISASKLVAHAARADAAERVDRA